MYMCAGVAFFALDRQTFRSIHFPYPQYATPYSPIVTTTHRTGVDRMSTGLPRPGSPNPVRGAATGILVGPLKRHVYRSPATPPRFPPRHRKRPGSPPRKAHRMVRLFGSVVTRPPRVQLLGLLPAILKPCGPACAQPFTNRNVEAMREEEWHETPAFVIENADRAHRIAEDLVRDFGDRVRIEVVGFDSPRGAWLGLRHQIGKGFAVIVVGREGCRDPKDSDPIKCAVSRALSTRPAPA